MRRRGTVVVAFGLCLATATVIAQQPVFRTQVELVRVDVAVSRDGKPVAGLGPQDFELRDGGVRQVIREVLVENVPLDVVLLLDTSTSVAGRRLERLQDAAARMLQGLRRGDRAALMTFGHRVSRLHPLTSDLPPIARLVASLEGNGSTALHDAVFAGLLQPQAAERRSVIVVFSDGLDTVSWLSPQQILDAAKHGASIVYTVVEIEDPMPSERNPATMARAFLETLAKDTGGRTWWVPDPDQIGSAFAQILQDLTTRYVLLYQPEGVAGDGWHPLSVKLARARGTVAARTGYFRR